MTDLQANVERGCAWLDEVRPRWADEIDPGRLAMSYGGRCVLGQLAQVVGRELGLETDDAVGYADVVLEGYSPGLACIRRALGLTEPLGAAMALELGFSTDRGGSGWAELDRHWLTAIRQRRRRRLGRLRRAVRRALP